MAANCEDNQKNEGSEIFDTLLEFANLTKERSIPLESLSDVLEIFGFEENKILDLCTHLKNITQVSYED